MLGKTMIIGWILLAIVSKNQIGINAEAVTVAAPTVASESTTEATTAPPPPTQPPPTAAPPPTLPPPTPAPQTPPPPPTQRPPPGPTNPPATLGEVHTTTDAAKKLNGIKRRKGFAVLFAAMTGLVVFLNLVYVGLFVWLCMVLKKQIA